MTKKNLTTTISPVESFDGGAEHHGPAEVQLGQWYWVTHTVKWDGEWTDNGKPLKEGAETKWLGCVMKIGSNFVELESPPYQHSSSSARIHFDDFEGQLKFASDAEAHIVERQAFYKNRINALMIDIKDITAKLGVVPTHQVSDQSGEGQNGLVVVSSKPDTTAYKKALIKAADKTLPKLFEEMKKANSELARWMIAPTMALTASIGPMQETIGAVKDRIYTIELYAGLTEEAVKCRDGKPAARDEKLRVMQRRLYMDEECLANYTAGGMEFKDVEAFDKWISKTENRNRLLPFPRTLAAFRVRRTDKERENDGNIWKMLVNFQLQNTDKKTFLYVRNGEQVWRVDCDFEFDEMIIPNKDQFNPSEPMMVKMRGGDSIDDIMPRARWESLVAEDDERHKKYEAWASANPEEHDWDNPFRDSSYRDLNYYKPFDQTNVHFDDALKEIAGEIKRYNRIAVIVQGLFDRSEVLHPHAPVKMWEAESFNQSVELVYDAVTLTYGEKPDFEAFRVELNGTMTADSVVTGQEDFWLRKEARKENTRISNDWRQRGTHPNYTRYRPSEEGPPLVGRMTEWKLRGRKAVFTWTYTHRGNRDYGAKKTGSVSVPVSELFNVSAYKSGDFKRFFADPRTRVEYLKWAPLLLAAEDWHAGKLSKLSGATVYGVRY